jgi:hypothetical protein
MKHLLWLMQQLMQYQQTTYHFRTKINRALVKC